jgi:catechol 2,3-dioxygenase-like lactoylglutathione lyase family enzyme
VDRVVGLDHVQLAMPPGREDEAEAFYSGLLGIPRVPKPPVLAARGGCWFEDPPLRLHLGVEADFRPARKAHPALAVVGLNRLAARLRAAGLEVRPGDGVEGQEQCYVDDPFGNRIELIERDPGRAGEATGFGTESGESRTDPTDAGSIS